ncbi:hypothetical protein EV359DRAFT_80592 [Lentinula novae-zelandiae]|nr:hypothetical protein EV359DRAFT_80592 [Lentinula novae-zelandiae]
MASAMSSSTTTIAPLHNTVNFSIHTSSQMGALLIGVLISCALWGISTAQTYIYFSTFYHHDTLRLKSLVVFIFVLDTAHQIMLSHSIYIYLVSNFGNVEYLEVVEHTSHGFIVGSHRCDHSTVHVLAHLDLYDRFCSIFSRSTDGLFAGLSVAQIIIVFTSFAITMVYFKKSWSLRTWTKLADLSKISRAVNGLNFGGDIAITLNARDQLRKSNRPIGSSLFSNPTLSGLEWARAMASDTVITSSDIPKSGTNLLSIKQEVETHVHHDIELDNLAVKTLSSILPA